MEMGWNGQVAASPPRQRSVPPLVVYRIAGILAPLPRVCDTRGRRGPTEERMSLPGEATRVCPSPPTHLHARQRRAGARARVQRLLALGPPEAGWARLRLASACLFARATVLFLPSAAFNASVCEEVT